MYSKAVFVDTTAYSLIFLWGVKVPISNHSIVFPRLFCSLPVGHSCRVHSLCSSWHSTSSLHLGTQRQVCNESQLGEKGLMRLHLPGKKDMLLAREGSYLKAKSSFSCNQLTS